jgi:hypothetical protein
MSKEHEGEMVRVQVWSLCPFRSPCVPAEKSALHGVGDRPPEQVLGPCLYAACGLWKITEVRDGKAVDGQCGVRFLGEVMNSIAGSLEQLVKLELTKNGGAQIFGEKVDQSAKPS